MSVEHHARGECRREFLTQLSSILSMQYYRSLLNYWLKMSRKSDLDNFSITCTYVCIGRIKCRHSMGGGHESNQLPRKGNCHPPPPKEILHHYIWCHRVVAYNVQLCVKDHHQYLLSMQPNNIILGIHFNKPQSQKSGYCSLPQAGLRKWTGG